MNRTAWPLFSSFAILSFLTVATSCTGGSGGSFQVTIDRNGGTFVTSGDGRWIYESRQEMADFHAELVEEESGEETRLLRLDSLTSHGKADHDDAMRWLWTQIEPSAKLRLLGGEIIEHPDLETRDALMADVDERVATEIDDLDLLGGSFFELLRIESRASFLLEVFETAPKTLDILDELLEAASSDNFERPTPSGFTPGGSASSGRRELFLAFARYPELNQERADRLAHEVPTIGWDSYEGQILIELARGGVASTRALLTATKHLASDGDHRDVLLEIARTRPQSGDLVAAEVPSIGWDSYEKQVLVRLIDESDVGVPAVLQACESIPSDGDHRSVLVSLVRRGMDEDDADRVARSCPSIGWDSYERQVLVQLVDETEVSVRAVLDAASHLPSDSDHLKVLEALTRRPLTAEDADRVARACPSIGWDSYEKSALISLIPHPVSVRAVLDATSHISSSGDHRNVLLRLVQRDMTTKEADSIARACASIGWDSYERQVLVELASSSASVTAVLEGASHVNTHSDHRRVLLALCGRDDLTQSDANLIAQHTPTIGWDSYERQVLIALIGKASQQTLRASANQLGSSDRLKVLDALVR